MKKHIIISLLKVLPVSLITMAIGSWFLYFSIKFFSQDFTADDARFLFLDSFSNVAIAAAGIFFILVGIVIIVATIIKERFEL